MPESLKWEIPCALFGHLNNLIPSSQNPLSMLINPEFTMETTPGVNSDIIREAGIKDAMGNLSPAFQRTLQVLADPDACADLRVVYGNSSYQNTFYFSKGFSRSVSVLTSQEKIIICDPGDIDSAVIKLQELIGSNLTRTYNLNTNLSYYQSLVLGSMLDIQRKADLLSLVENRSSQKILVVQQDIVEHLNQVKVQNSLQWFAANIMRKRSTDYDHFQIEIALQDLETAGFTLFEDGKYTLAGHFEDLSKHFGLLKTIIDMDVQRYFRKNQKTVSVQYQCLQSGVNDTLLMVFKENHVHLVATEPKSFIEDVQFQINGNGISQIEEPVEDKGIAEATIVLGSADLIWQLVSKDTGKPISLKDVMRLGRNPDSQIIFNEPSISRAHAIIEIQNSECWITDLNSRNGTFVNNVKIKQPTKLSNMDILKIGPFEFEVNSVISGVLPTQALPRQ